MPLARSRTEKESFLAFVECAGCGELFPVRKKLALNRAKWCSERCRKRQYAGTCAECGAPTSGHNGRGPNASARCASCQVQSLVAIQKERGLEHQALVERLWADGLTGREIGNCLGWTCAPSSYIAVLRNRGYNLPYRRTPEQRARITRGADKNLAKARSMRSAA